MYGNLTVSGGFSYLASGLNPGLNANSIAYLNVGQSLSNYNAAQFGFNYSASGSTTNYVSIGLYGTSAPEVTISNTGLAVTHGITASGTLTVSGTATILNNLSVTGGLTCGSPNSLGAPVSITGSSGTGLTLGGTLTALKSGGGVWTATSDARLKKNVEDYEKGLEDVEKMRPVSFQYNGKHECAPDSGKRYVGFIAQEAQKVFPDMVEPMDDEDAYLTLDTTELIYALVNSVKTLSARVKSLESQLLPPVVESRKRPASDMEL